MKFVVSATPSLNVLKGKWACLNWKKKYHRELRNYNLFAPKEKVKTTMTIQRFGSRILDLDNYHGGCKPLIDCLKEIKYIVDDRPEWCEIIFLPQVKTSRYFRKTEIEISRYKTSNEKF